MEIKTLQFSENELLNYEDMKTYITEKIEINRAKLIASKINKRITFQGKFIYLFNEKTKIYHSFEKGTGNNSDIIHIVSSLIATSYKNLNDLQKENLSSRGKAFDAIFKNTNIAKYMPQLETELKDTNINFNQVYLGEIHFLNGYYDLKANEFKPRTDKHKITICIKRKYKEPKNKSKNKIRKLLKMIYPIKADRDYLLTKFAILHMSSSNDS